MMRKVAWWLRWVFIGRRSKAVAVGCDLREPLELFYAEPELSLAKKDLIRAVYIGCALPEDMASWSQWPSRKFKNCTFGGTQ